MTEDLLPLPITPADALLRIVRPAMIRLPCGGAERAEVMLISIALQESALKYRKQIKGPARGLWQFEQGGGVAGVLSHPMSKRHAVDVCEARGVKPAADKVYTRLAYDDILAACFARLLLWTDPKPLPEVGDEADAWALYKRTWRPGKPHPDRWPKCYEEAMRAVELVDALPK